MWLLDVAFCLMVSVVTTILTYHILQFFDLTLLPPYDYLLGVIIFMFLFLSGKETRAWLEYKYGDHDGQNGK